MSILLVPSQYATIADAFAAASIGDVIQLAPGYVSESAIAVVGGVTVTGDSSNTGITLTLAAGVSSLSLGGNARINVTADPFTAATLIGNAGSNVLSGSRGDDILRGGAGADTLDGGRGTDTADYSASAGAVLIDLTAHTASGGDAQGDTLVSIENLFGSAGADTLTGNGSNNILRGGTGADTLNGGAGSDTADYSTSTTAVFVNLAANTASGGDAQGDVLSNIENILGGASNDTLTGDANANLLNGGAGGDTLSGGAGNDIYIVDSAGDVVIELAGQGTDEVRTTLLSYALDADLENLTGLNTAGQVLTGNALDNVVTAGSGNDTLTGGAGADILNGGAGIDTVDYSRETGVLGISVGVGSGAYDTFGSYDTLSDIENVIGSIGSDTINGNDLKNVLSGGDGNDTLNGYQGDDTLIGGRGDDLYILNYYDSADVIVENPGEGFDTLSTHAISVVTLGENLEDVNSTVVDVLTGNSNSNHITVAQSLATTIYGLGGDDFINAQSVYTVTAYGGDGNDLIIGTRQSDVIDGGDGVDTVYYGSEFTSGGLVIDLAQGTATNVEGSVDRLIGIENVIGGGYFADLISGDAGANRLDGDGGNDTIFGGGGQDQLYGGLGNDTLVGNSDPFAAEADQLSGEIGDDVLYAEAADTLDGGMGFDSLIAVNAYDFAIDLATSSIEYAVMDFGNDIVVANAQTVAVSVFASGGNDQVTGSAFGDLLFGGVGNDVVNGGDGDDAIVGELGVDGLDGGAGNDRIYFDAQDSFIVGGSGYDAGYITVGAGGGAAVNAATASLEFLQDLAGQSDVITAAGANAALTAYAGGGDDTVDGSLFADVFWGEAGDDALSGSQGDDVLVGGQGSDRLVGGAGNDALFGNGGSGGDGARDVFVFTQSTAANADAVYDFEHGVDKLDFSAFPASFASVSIADAGGSAVVYCNGELICTVVGVAAATLTAGDFVFSSPETGGPEAAAPLVGGGAFSDGAYGAGPAGDALAPDDATPLAHWTAPVVHPWDAWLVAAA